MTIEDSVEQGGATMSKNVNPPLVCTSWNRGDASSPSSIKSMNGVMEEQTRGLHSELEMTSEM